MLFGCVPARRRTPTTLQRSLNLIHGVLDPFVLSTCPKVKRQLPYEPFQHRSRFCNFVLPSTTESEAAVRLSFPRSAWEREPLAIIWTLPAVIRTLPAMYWVLRRGR